MKKMKLIWLWLMYIVVVIACIMSKMLIFTLLMAAISGFILFKILDFGD